MAFLRIPHRLREYFPGSSLPRCMPMPSPADQHVEPASASGTFPNKELRVRCAYILSEQTPHRLNLDEVLRWQPNQGPLWIHFDHGQTIPEWLKKQHAIDSAVLESLRAEVRRPRVEVMH